MLTLRVPTEEDVWEAQRIISEMPQIEVKTDHFFSGGMYARKFSFVPGTLVVGKKHKTDHFFMCTKGNVLVWEDGKAFEMNAGDIVESKIGAKRVVYSIVESSVVAMHKSDKKDLNELELELMEFDPTALFDFNNDFKAILIEKG